MKNSPSCPTPIKQSIDLTTSTIDRRSFHFRNTVIAVVVVAAASFVAALILRSWRPLTALFLLPSIVGYFIMTDTLLVGKWRKTVINHWGTGAIELNAYIQTIAMMKSIPKATIEGMFQLLPQKSGSIPKEKEGLRRALAETDHAIMTVHTIRTLLTLSVYGALPIVIGVSLLMHSFIPLCGIALPVITLIITLSLEWNRWRRWRRIMTTRIAGNEIDREAFIDAIPHLAWGPNDEKLKSQMLHSLGSS
ncbi:MAG: hypothetical protein JW863_09525 [Chitinispirillaceae bacterium]|nr:hypothetical protein [Chitinispirillaceae bacterium]